MAYNRFRWWESSLKKRRNLAHKAPLLSKIRNGDFSYPYEYISAIEKVQDEINYIEHKAREEYKGSDPFVLEEKIHEACRMKSIRKRKLEEEFLEKENTLLLKFKTELNKLFGMDLWDDIMNGNFKGETLEDLYNHYAQNLKTYENI